MADEPDLTRLPFAQAIAYFRQKLNLPSDDWQAVQGEENDWAFAVATVTDAEMLADLRAALDKYIAQGNTFESFAKDFNKIAEDYGWRPKQDLSWRAEIVARTNLRTAFAAGQFQQRQNPAVRRLRPGLKWVHRDSPQARPHHLALDGKVFDSSDPMYSGLSAPSGFGCRCRLFSVPVPEKGYDSLSDRLPYTLPDGRRTEIPAVSLPRPGREPKLYPIADPGFYYAPGASPESERPRILQTLIDRQPPAMRQMILAVLPDSAKRRFLGG